MAGRGTVGMDQSAGPPPSSDMTAGASEALGRILAAAAERLPDTVLLADAEGRIAHVNAAGCAALGYDRADVLGRAVADILAAAPGAAWPDLLQRLPGAPHVTVETSLRHRDGAPRPVELVA